MNKIKTTFQSFVSYITHCLTQARSKGLYRKLAVMCVGVIGIFFAIFFFIRLATYLFESIYNFINIHFWGVAATILGGTWIRLKWGERRDQRNREEQESKLAKDRIKMRFSEGSYDKVRKFLFTQILNEANFESLTGLYRPLNPAELGNAQTGNYIKNSLIFHQFRVPKVCLDDVNVSLVTSVLQSMIEQKLSVYGIPGIISPTHMNRNDVLMVSDVSDMKTHVILTTVLSFNGEYAEQAAYDRAMADSFSITTAERTLDDYDYHE